MAYGYFLEVGAASQAHSHLIVLKVGHLVMYCIGLECSLPKYTAKPKTRRLGFVGTPPGPRLTS